MWDLSKNDHSLSVSHRSSLSVTASLRHNPITIIILSVVFSAPWYSKLRQLRIRPITLFSLGRFQVHYGVHSPGKAKRLSSARKRGCPVVEVGSKLHRRTSDVGHAHDRGMANKENELTCSDDVRGNCGLPVNSAEASKMAGASSKYSDFTEVRIPV